MFLRNATTYMTPSGLVDVYRRFEETYCLYEAGSGMFLRKSIISYQFAGSHNPAYYFYNTHLLNNSNLISLSCQYLHKKEKTDGPINRYTLFIRHRIFSVLRNEEYCTATY